MGQSLSARTLRDAFLPGSDTRSPLLLGKAPGYLVFIDVCQIQIGEPTLFGCATGIWRPPYPGFTSTFTRGFIAVAFQAPVAGRFLVLEPLGRLK